MRFVRLCFMVLLYSSTGGFGDRIIADGVVATSLVRLLAHPEEYSGKRVTVCGVLSLEFEETALFLSRDDAVYSNLEHSFWLELSPEELKRFSKLKSQYVRIEGAFRYEKGKGKGHLGMWVAELRDVKCFSVSKR